MFCVKVYLTLSSFSKMDINGKYRYFSWSNKEIKKYNLCNL